MIPLQSADAGPYVVFPTEAWTVCEPQNGVEHLQPPALQGGVALNGFVHLFARTSDDQIYAQHVVIQTSDQASAPWVTLLQGEPEALLAAGISVRSQAPPAAFSAQGLIFLVFSGADDDNRIFMCRAKYAPPGQPATLLEWAPIEMQFGDQFVRPGYSPCVATIDGKVFLAWPDAGFRYFYSVGTIGAPDGFGPTITWGPAQVVPGTETWVTNDFAVAASVTAFKKGAASGFILMSAYVWHPPILASGAPFGESGGANDSQTHESMERIWYVVYDSSTGTFTSGSPIPLGSSGVDDDSDASYVGGCTLVANEDLVVPVLVDNVGNITYYQLDPSVPNYGTFAEWLQCAIGGGGITVGVGVAIPPAISINGDIDTGPIPQLSAMTIYPGVNGGALICGQFYDPFIGDNKLGFAAVALNLGLRTF
jgi:hypothetical protein